MAEESRIRSGDVVGMPVYSQDGLELGVVIGLIIEVERWQVTALELRIRKEAREALDLGRAWFKRLIGQLDVAQVAGFGDSVVLSPTAAEVRIEGLGQRRNRALASLPAPASEDDEDGAFVIDGEVVDTDAP